MNEQESVWYYTQHGERKGPVTLEVLRGAIEHMKIDREKDLMWGPGLSDWVTMDKVPELQDMPAGPPASSAPATSQPSPPASGIGAANKASPAAPATPPDSSEDDNALAGAMTERREGGGYPGMGRLMFWVAPFCICAAAYLILFVFLGSLDFNKGVDLLGFVPLAIVAVAIIACIFTIFSRLKNLEMSRWFVLLYCVPVANVWLDYRLYICPAGYSFHKKLDLPAKLMIGFVIVLICAPVVRFCFADSVLPQAARDQPAKVVLPTESE